MKNVLSFAAAALVVFGINSTASAAWQPILTVNTPYTGTAPSFQQIKTAALKVEKQGEGCPATVATYQAIGADQFGNPLALTLIEQGQTATGARVYTVTVGGVPTVATVYQVAFTTTRSSGLPCAYVFSARVIDDNF